MRRGGGLGTPNPIGDPRPNSVGGGVELTHIPSRAAVGKKPSMDYGPKNGLLTPKIPFDPKNGPKGTGGVDYSSHDAPRPLGTGKAAMSARSSQSVARSRSEALWEM